MHPVQAMAVALNTLTRQQVWAAERLAQHAGKTVRITVGGFQLNWSIERDGQLVRALDSATPDVTLDILVEKINPSVFFEQARRPDMAQYIHVTGQASLAQVLSELARDLRPDPEDALSQWIGDVPARRVVQGARKALDAAQTFGLSLSQNLAEYLSEETDALVGKPAMLTQKSSQADLLSALERLEQGQSHLQTRVQRLERSAGARK